MQIIFHIDLNAFFASAEVSVQPSLKDKPIVVCGESRRSIITTASYEARKYGIHSAMPLFQAKKLCSDLIVLPINFQLYRSLSQQFFQIISSFSTKLEVASIDECYVDMTDYIQQQHQTPYDVAQIMQKKVYEKLNLGCSIGIAPNKFLAKMASDMKKPMGITVITNRNYKNIIWQLPIEKMMGIGKKTAPKLRDLNINIIADIAKYENFETIKMVLGKSALIYYQRANGKDYSKIKADEHVLKSIGHSTTFEYDSHDEAFIRSVFKDLSLEVSKRAKKSHLLGKSLSITLKYSRSKSRTKQMALEQYTHDFDLLFATALILFESVYKGEDLRLVGVSLNHLIYEKDLQQQLSFFDTSMSSEQTTNHTEMLINTLNKSLDGMQVMKASSLSQKNKK